MIVGFQVLADRPPGRRHLRQPQAARGSLLPRALAGASGAAMPTSRPLRRRAPPGVDPTLGSLTRGRSRSGIDRHPGLQRSGGIADVVALAHAVGAAGARSSSSTTARRTTTGARAAAAGATVVRHPYNKGNGAAVKSGIRTATGDLRDDRRRRRPAPRPAMRSDSSARLGEYDLVIGARTSATQATPRPARSATARSTGSPATSPSARFPI